MPVITGERAKLEHTMPFDSLLYFVKDKHQIPDPKFDPGAQATVYVGHERAEGCKCLKGCSFDYSNKGYRGHIMFSAHGWSDPFCFSFRKEERKVSFLYPEQCICKEKKSLIRRYLFHQKLTNEFILSKCNIIFRVRHLKISRS